MHTVIDGEGVIWTVSVAYQVPDPIASNTPLAVLWFETATGRTASLRLPARSVATLSDEEMLVLLSTAIQGRGRTPGA